MKTTHKLPYKKRSRRPEGQLGEKAREIIASLNEAIEVERAGIPIESRFTVRTVHVPDPPRAYDAVAIRATRDKIGASQAVFAFLMGVSTALIRAWEQGDRPPALWGRRLLDEMNRDPNHWRGMLRKAS
jgi:DNA-binding transcriptional regulator YiaG